MKGLDSRKRDKLNNKTALHTLCDGSKLNGSGAAPCLRRAHQSSSYGFRFNATSSGVSRGPHAVMLIILSHVAATQTQTEQTNV